MTARANGSSGLDYARRLRVEQLALANMKSTNLNPMEEWDRAVAVWMAKDNCSRDAAVDRIWGRTTWGSALWQRACTWHASQPQIAIENGREVRSGNWQNSGFATLRRIPRRP
jgi:hypothetical protein